MPKAIRLAPSLVALLLGASTLSSAAEAGWFSSDPKPGAAATNGDAQGPAQPAATLDDSIRQAQVLRLAGNYKEALNHLSQLMLIAADDGRVISEYGKTLVSMGRTEEAQKFLSRAQQLQPNDWTVYSALGVAYDQLGNQQEAKVNYERALALRPGEPSVLSNYALSRMLAKDPVDARKLAERAEIANAPAPDAKIARDIAMIRSMVVQSEDAAVNMPAPSSAPVAAPHVAVAAAPLRAPAAPVQTAPAAIRPVPTAASVPPRPVAANSVIQARPQVSPMLNQAPRGVVMQPVPVDPLAGPVQTKAATRAPRSLQPRAQASNDTPIKPEARPAAPRPADTAKSASPAESLEARAEAIAKTLNKPGAIAQAKAEAVKDQPAKPAAKVSVQVKAQDVKSNAAHTAPKVLPPTVVKAADAKPATTKTAAAKPKDAIPGLRLSANAY